MASGQGKVKATAVLEVIYPGSFVWIHGKRGGESFRKYARVLKRTRTQFVIDDWSRSRFRRSDGEEIGGLHDYIERIATVEEIAAFDLEKAARAARELEMAEEERCLRALMRGRGLIELTRRGMRYEMRLTGLSAARVRALYAAYKGAGGGSSDY